MLPLRSCFYMLHNGRTDADRYVDCCRGLSRLSKWNYKHYDPAAAPARWSLCGRQAPLLLASITVEDWDVSQYTTLRVFKLFSLLVILYGPSSSTIYSFLYQQNTLQYQCS